MKPLVAVTGGAGALGSTLAAHLYAKGYRIALFDVEPAKTRLAEVGKPLEAATFAGDLGRKDTWDAALQTLGEAPTHAALIAGGWAGGKPLYQDDDSYEKNMRSNVDTVFRSLRALLPGMVERKAGSVVVVGSRAAVQPWTSANAATYAASKAAVIAMSEAAAAEVLEHGVRINAVMPSTMDTRANRSSMPKADFTKWVSLESASGVVAFLLSDDAKDISGAALPLYGRA